MKEKETQAPKAQEKGFKADWAPIPIEQIVRKDGLVLVFPFLGTAGATAANYDQVFTAPRGFSILEVHVCWSVASTSGTLQLERLRGTQAPGAGTTILATTISTAGTANTVVIRSKTQLTAGRSFAEGDRLAFIDGGTLTNLVGLHVTLYCKPNGKGDYR